MSGPAELDSATTVLRADVPHSVRAAPTPGTA